VLKSTKCCRTAASIDGAQPPTATLARAALKICANAVRASRKGIAVSVCALNE
jgi:hypothetical protein